MLLALTVSFSLTVNAQIIGYDENGFSSIFQTSKREIYLDGEEIADTEYFVDPNFEIPLDSLGNSMYGIEDYSITLDLQSMYNRYKDIYDDFSGYNIDLALYEPVSVRMTWIFHYDLASFMTLLDTEYLSLEFDMLDEYELIRINDSSFKLVADLDVSDWEWGVYLGHTTYDIGFSFSIYDLFSYEMIVEKPSFLITFFEIDEETGSVPSTDVDCLNDYTLLPSLVDQTFIEIQSIEVIDEIFNVYEFGFYLFPYTYYFRLALPEELLDFDELDPSRFAYGYEATHRMLYYQPDPDLSPDPTVDFDENMFAFDLTLGVYNHFYTVQTVGFTCHEANSVASLYMFLPKTIDYLISIELSYIYRLKYLIGYSDWIMCRNSFYTYNQDPEENVWLNYSEIDPPRWVLLALIFPYFIGDWADIYNDHEIEQFTSGELPVDVRSSYLEEFDGSVYDLDDFYYYRIILGQYRDLFSIGFDISNVVILNLSYIKDGVIVSVPQENIQQKIEDWVETNPSIIEIITDTADTLFDSVLSTTLGKIVAGVGVLVLVYFGIMAYSALKKAGYQRLQNKEYRNSMKKK